MTAVAASLPPRRISRRSLIVVTLVVATIATLLYVEWRTFSSAPASTAEAQPDTMCMASRIGLPCR